MHQVETVRDIAHQDAPNPAAVYLARLGPGSRRAMAQAIEWHAREASAGRCTAETMPWHLLRYQHTQVLRARVVAEYAPATANRFLAALRGVLKEARRLELMTAEQYHQAVDLENVPTRALPAGRALEEAEVAALFGRCASEGRPGRVKDAAVLAVLLGAGLRRSELVALEMADYQPGSGALRVRRGKGNVERLVWITGDAQRAVNDWIELRGSTPGPLFCPVDRCGRVELRKMSTQAVYALLKRRAYKAGVRHFSPHDCRRTYVSALLDAGADVVAVQGLAGHASVITTARYDRRGDRARRKAAELIRIPYVPAASAQKALGDA